MVEVEAPTADVEGTGAEAGLVGSLSVDDDSAFAVPDLESMLFRDDAKDGLGLASLSFFSLLSVGEASAFLPKKDDNMLDPFLFISGASTFFSSSFSFGKILHPAGTISSRSCSLVFSGRAFTATSHSMDPLVLRYIPRGPEEEITVERVKRRASELRFIIGDDLVCEGRAGRDESGGKGGIIVWQRSNLYGRCEYELDMLQ